MNVFDRTLAKPQPAPQPASTSKNPFVVGDVFFFRYSDLEDFKSFKEVYLWDLDKTYLDTSWGSLKELWRTALEKAFQKRNVPGTASLVTALKVSWLEEKGRVHFPLFFITASPPQMEPRIRQKWELDDIMPLASFFKDNLKNLKPSRFWMLTHQLGFKLQALMQLRLSLHDEVTQVLWGDDSEADAVIYSLYSDICARRRTEAEFRRILKDLRVTGEQLEKIFEIQNVIPYHDPVDKIYINLATDTDAEYYLKFGRRVVATQNSFQTALDLYQDGRLNLEQVVRVGLDMMMNYSFTPELLTQSYDDLIRRRILGETAFENSKQMLMAHDLIPKDFEPSVPPAKEITPRGHRDYQPDGIFEPWIPEQIDYLHDYR